MRAAFRSAATLVAVVVSARPGIAQTTSPNDSSGQSPANAHVERVDSRAPRFACDCPRRCHGGVVQASSKGWMKNGRRTSNAGSS
jgi:hypothetical protein